ncbi:hypothetical protein NUW54_g10817 [Trametes sanguinea]|uniref:Uncharacterized protein n=1 Tax=Trametes sanguinea TaxID=158606 RepID=A0ACC1NSP8_9APHY|nr:hypothetical protein NUW54_g10817 [Trametes sanguinea]
MSRRFTLKYRKVVEAILQSAAIYSAASIVLVITYFTSPTVGYNLCVGVFPSLIGLVFSFIVLRLAKRSREDGVHLVYDQPPRVAPVSMPAMREHLRTPTSPSFSVHLPALVTETQSVTDLDSRAVRPASVLALDKAHVVECIDIFRGFDRLHPCTPTVSNSASLDTRHCANKSNFAHQVPSPRAHVRDPAYEDEFPSMNALWWRLPLIEGALCRNAVLLSVHTGIYNEPRSCTLRFSEAATSCIEATNVIQFMGMMLGLQFNTVSVVSVFNVQTVHGRERISSRFCRASLGTGSRFKHIIAVPKILLVEGRGSSISHLHHRQNAALRYLVICCRVSACKALNVLSSTLDTTPLKVSYEGILNSIDARCTQSLFPLARVPAHLHRSSRDPACHTLRRPAVVMPFAELRALHAVIGQAIDEIEKVYKSQSPPLEYPALDVPYYSSQKHSPEVDKAEELKLDPAVFSAANQIVAACGQLTATVHKPFFQLVEIMNGPNITALFHFVEQTHIPEILREAGPAGLSTKDIAAKLAEYREATDRARDVDDVREPRERLRVVLVRARRAVVVRGEVRPEARDRAEEEHGVEIDVLQALGVGCDARDEAL